MFTSLPASLQSAVCVCQTDTDIFVPWGAVDTGFSVTVDLKTAEFSPIGMASAFDVMRISGSHFKFPPSLLSLNLRFHPAPVAPDPHLFSDRLSAQC